MQRNSTRERWFAARRFYERCFSSQPAAVRKFVEERLLSAEGFREGITLDTAMYELGEANLSRAAASEAIARLVLAEVHPDWQRRFLDDISLRILDWLRVENLSKVFRIRPEQPTVDGIAGFGGF